MWLVLEEYTLALPAVIEYLCLDSVLWILLQEREHIYLNLEKRLELDTELVVKLKWLALYGVMIYLGCAGDEFLETCC